MFHGLVSMWCKSCNELVESKHTRFFESVHATSDSDVDVAVRGDVDIVLVPYFLGNIERVDSNVLVVWHGFT